MIKERNEAKIEWIMKSDAEMELTAMNEMRLEWIWWNQNECGLMKPERKNCEIKLKVWLNS